MWFSVCSQYGRMEVRAQPKEKGAFPHQLTGSENLGQQCSAPGVASFSKLSSCTGGQKKNGSIPLCDRQHDLQLKFRGPQMLGVYTISYKYIKCNVQKKKRVWTSVWTKRWPVPIATFTTDRHFWEPQSGLMCSLCWLENKWICEHRVGVGFVPQSLL